MATFKPTDARDIICALYEQVTGETGLTNTDVSTFASVGETLSSLPTDQLDMGMTILVTKTIIAFRDYTPDTFIDLDAEEGTTFTMLMRKISYYDDLPEYSGAWNTNLYTNFADGYDNGNNGGSSVSSMWKQKKRYTYEKVFGTFVTWDDCLTIYEKQWELAFTSEEEFVRFFNSLVGQKEKEIKMQKESFRRGVMLNAIAQRYHSYAGKCVRNLTALFNAEKGTSYTSAQLRTTYLKDFLAFMVKTFKIDALMMKEENTFFHYDAKATFDGVDKYILRNTPLDMQRLYLYSPLILDAETQVLPEIFNDSYLQLKNYKPVNYWQSPLEADKMKINVDANVYDPTTGKGVKVEGITIPYVIGVLMDPEAVKTSFNIDQVATSPLEARKHYKNTWYNLNKGAIDDVTEKMIIYIMEDPAETTEG